MIVKVVLLLLLHEFTSRISNRLRSQAASGLKLRRGLVLRFQTNIPQQWLRLDDEKNQITGICSVN